MRIRVVFITTVHVHVMLDWCQISKWKEKITHRYNNIGVLDQYIQRISVFWAMGEIIKFHIFISVEVI